jgi:hypothetical protein
VHLKLPFENTQFVPAPIDRAEIADAHKVKQRLKKLVKVIAKLVGLNVDERTYQIRKFLFEGYGGDEASAIMIREDTEAYWIIKDVGIVQFANPDELLAFVHSLNDTISVLADYIQQLCDQLPAISKLRTLYAERFATLVYTFMIFVHAYNNGNKRTSHSLAWTYLRQLDPEGSVDYQPQHGIEIKNKADYVSDPQMGPQLINQILNHSFDPQHIHWWFNFVIYGKFGERDSNGTEFPLCPTVQKTLDLVLEQIQQNQSDSDDELSPTHSRLASENFFADTQRVASLDLES